MKYRVIVSPKAFAALEEFVDYIAIDQQSPLIALRWFEKAWASIQSLQFMPHRCPPAPENEFSKYTIRMKIVDRCLFLYRVDEKNRVVRVMGFRHGSRQPIDLEE